MYNTDEQTVRYFAGTESHNTIMLGNFDQMQKGMRFIWFYPPTLLSANLQEEDDAYLFEGKINAFKQMREGITVQRTIRKRKGFAEWMISDKVEGTVSNEVKRQLWHTDDANIQFASNGERKEKEGWTSDYYGVKRETKEIEFQISNEEIETRIEIAK